MMRSLIVASAVSGLLGCSAMAEPPIILALLYVSVEAANNDHLVPAQVEPTPLPQPEYYMH